MIHVDDPRHIVYATRIIPKLFPYMRDLLDELTRQPSQENIVHSLMDAVFAQLSNTSCPA